jgi:hypothetical protein
VSGYFGRILVKVDGTTGEAWIRIMVDGDSEGSEFGRSKPRDSRRA